MENYPKPIKSFGLRYIWQIFLRLLLVMLIYSLLRLCFFLFNHYLFADIDPSRLLQICRGGLRFDLAALFYTNGLYIVLALLPFTFIYTRAWQGMLKTLFITINSLAAAVNLVDFAYFRFTLKRTDCSFFQEFRGDVNLGGIAANAVTDYWPLLIILAFVICCLVFFYGKNKYDSDYPSTYVFFIRRLISLVIAVLIAIAGIRGGINRTTRPITLSNAGAYIVRPVEAGIVLNTPFSLIRTISRKSLSRLSYFADEGSLEAVYTPLHRPSTSDTALLEPKPNVVVFILESFSKEHISGLNPNGKGFTPFLDSLMSLSHVCTNAYANGRKSIDAIPSVLGGIPSFETPFVLTPYALDNVDGLGNLLQREGYYTAFFHGAPNGSMGFDALANMMGFQNYYGKTEYANDSDYDGVWGIWDEPFLQFFARTLDSLPQPFATSIFTLSSHHPFKVPKQYEDVFPKGSQPIHQCIGYTDNALRKFFAYARQSSWFDNTLFVLVADHGAFSPENADYQSPLGSMQIPVVYYWEDHIVPCRDSLPSQQTDILPSILGFIHYPKPFIAFGSNVFDPERKSFVVNYPDTHHIIRNEKEPDNGLFLQAVLQQYYNRLIDNRLKP